MRSKFVKGGERGHELSREESTQITCREIQATMRRAVQLRVGMDGMESTHESTGMVQARGSTSSDYSIETMWGGKESPKGPIKNMNSSPLCLSSFSFYICFTFLFIFSGFNAFLREKI